MKAATNPNCLRLFLLYLSCLFVLHIPRVVGNMASPSHYGVTPPVRRNRQPKQKNTQDRPFLDGAMDNGGMRLMLNLYRRAADADGRPKHHKFFGSNTVRLLQATASEKRFYPASKDLQYSYAVKYELPNLSLDKLVKASFMHLRSPVPTHFICEAWVTSHQNHTEGLGVTMGPRSTWTESDVTQLVSQSKDGHVSFFTNYRCTKSGQAKSDSKKRFPPQNHLRSPVLLLYLDENKQPVELGKFFAPVYRPRTRRSRESGSIVSDIPNFKQGSNSVAKNQCKLHSYRVAFKDLGWDHWIIAPHKYNPQYCMGDCPRILHYGYNSPNHAIMQTFISELGVAEIPLPSCVPYKYKPISVLMMERNGNINYKEYEDMIADSCTCR